MRKTLCLAGLLALVTFPVALVAQEGKNSIPNAQIDSETFIQHVLASQERRENRRITEAQFIEMARDPQTIILDARSRDRYEQMHIQGAKSLSFTDFTAESLAQIIPDKDTRILIYCNNNIENSPIAFATKAAPASLNLSTYTALYTYGYTNIYELGPIIDPQISKIQFEGTLVPSHKISTEKNEIL